MRARRVLDNPPLPEGGLAGACGDCATATAGKARAADAEAKGEKVAQRDRALRRHCIVEWAVDAPEDLAVRELRQQRVDRIIEAQLRFLDEDHGGRGSDRFRDRSDAEDRVAPHRVLAAERLDADRIDVRLAAPADERDEAWHPAALDVTGHGLAHAGEPRFGQSGRARGLAPPCLVQLRDHSGWRH